MRQKPYIDIDVHGWKLICSSPKDEEEMYVGSYAALLSEPSLKSDGEVSNRRMAGK